jgi:hypothetical protein
MDGAAAQREPGSSRAPSRTSTTSSHSHRHHHARCGPNGTPAPQPSSFLQEKIRLRRAEKRMSEGSLSTSTGNTREEDNMDLGSPMRGSATASLPPARAPVGEDDVNAMGVKEIEKVLLPLYPSSVLLFSLFLFFSLQSRSCFLRLLIKRSRRSKLSRSRTGISNWSSITDGNGRQH